MTLHPIEGIIVPVTDLSRTVADCFKFRSRIGRDVAIHALRAYLLREEDRRDELLEMAEECRVHNVLRPYLATLERVS